MLKNNFFQLSSPLTGGEGIINTTITLDKLHPIFSGHFPGMPVVPGVCMMAIIKELLEEKIERKLILLQAANLKFLSLINPLENESVEVEIKFTNGENNTVVAEGSIFTRSLTFFKITRAVYQ